MSTKIALMGAGGKMGCRITDNIKDRAAYEVSYVEVSEEGIANLAERGLSVTPEDKAVEAAEVIILALPDRLIGRITEGLVPKMSSGSMLIGLDPAAAYAEVMPLREELTYFVSHPCHPPLFNEDTDAEKRHDWFGGVHAAQHIVCALHHGPEEDYVKGEGIAKDMFGNAEAPVIEAHRVTVEQMAILEPALVETSAATLIHAIHELKEEAVKMGVPEKAADAFLKGHLRTILAIEFGYSGFPFSDGALLAMEKAKERLFLPDWKENVMDLERIRKSTKEITGALSK